MKPRLHCPARFFKLMLLLYTCFTVFVSESFAGSNKLERECTPPGNPDIFGENQWNVYTFNSNDQSFSYYDGFLVAPSVNFRSTDYWPEGLTPSSNISYQGCGNAVSWLAKRKGFPCGYYSIKLEKGAGRILLRFNGNWVLDAQDYYNGIAWKGFLGADDQLEIAGIDNPKAFVSFEQSSLAEISIAGGASFCEGTSLRLSAELFPGAVYSWSNGATGRMISVDKAGTYTVNVAGTGSCDVSFTGSKTVTENSLPVISISGNTSICSGSGTTLVASGALQYYWQKNNNPSQSTLPLDLVPGATIAVGLRKLNSSYTGPSLRLVRFSDLARKQFGFTGNDLDTAAIKAWLGGEKGYVFYLFDQSGNGNNLSTSLRNGLELRFDGPGGTPVMVTDTEDHVGFTSPLDFTSAPGFTAIYGSKVSLNYSGSLLSGYNNDWFLGYWNGAKQKAYFGDWVSNDKAEPLVDTSFNIYTGVANGQNGRLYENGVLVADKPGHFNGPNGFSFGGPISSEYSTAQLTDLFFYDRELSDTDRKIVEFSISDYYSVDYFQPSGVTTVNPTITSNYVVSGIDTNGCVGQATATVTVQPLSAFYRDADGDGFGDVNNKIYSCTPASGYVADSSDCNDNNMAINPEATEVCGNGIDDNCNGQVDEGPGVISYFEDKDGDGFGSSNTALTSFSGCAIPLGYSTNSADCDDNDPAIYPGSPKTNTASGSTIIYVNKNATGKNDGSSWADAHTELRDALNGHCSENITQIWVAAGTYRPTGPLPASEEAFVLRNKLAVLGGFAGNETDSSQRNWKTNLTILSGEQQNVTGSYPFSWAVVENNNNLADSSAVLDGFTITGAKEIEIWNVNTGPSIRNCTIIGRGVSNLSKASPTFINCDFQGTLSRSLFSDDSRITLIGCNFLGSTPKGISANKSAVTIVNCSFTGINEWAVFARNSTVSISGSVFNNNSALFAGGAINADLSTLVVDNSQFLGNHSGNNAYGGGAICNTNGFLTVTNSLFDGNISVTKAGAISTNNSTVTIQKSVFKNNSAAADNDGGALYSDGDRSFTVFNSRFVHNYAGYSGAVAIYYVRNPIVANCSFEGNQSDGRGGALCLVAANLLAVNNSFSGNKSLNSAAFGHFGAGSSKMVNSIFWGNNAEIDPGGIQPDISYSIVQGGYPGVDNLDADPLFVSQPAIGQGINADLRLSKGSPAIDQGIDSANIIPIDLAGNARNVSVIDMGAYEYTGDLYYRDVDGDGFGNPADSVLATRLPPGYVNTNTDCNDAYADVYPGAPELCDGKDNDCNGVIDDPCFPPIVVKASAAAASACLNDGAITITATGGKSPFTYSINGINYQVLNKFTGLAAGSYTAYVKDSRNAVGTVSIAVTKLAALLVTQSVINASACANDGRITLGRTGGTSPFAYSIDGVNYSTANVFSNLPAGTYSGFVKDGKGCIATKTDIIVGKLAEMTVSASTVSAGSCTDDGRITLGRTGGTSPYTYSIDGVNYVTTNIFTGLKADSYTGYVKDAKGCIATKTDIIVGKLASMIVSARVVNASNCADDGQITLSRTGGTSPFTYSLDGTNYTTSAIFSNLAANTYTGYVKDGKGCIATKTDIVVTKMPAMVVSARVVNASNCADDGSITLSRTGGASPFTYSLDGVIYTTSAIFSNLAANTYTCYVKDGKGCIATKTDIVITKLPAMVVSARVVNASNCADDGSITLSRTGGSLPFTYSLDGITYGTNNIFSNLAANTYTGYVKDGKGCIATKTDIVVSKLPVMTVSFSKTNATLCPANGSITLGRVGGVSPFTYSIDGVNYVTTNKFINLVPGNYTGYVKDAKCAAVETGVITITGPACSSPSITKSLYVETTPTVKISPVPANTILNITLSGYNGNTGVQLLTMQGKVAKQEKLLLSSTQPTQLRINVAAFAPAMYLLVVTDNNGNQQTEKVVIVH